MLIGSGRDEGSSQRQDQSLKESSGLHHRPRSSTCPITLPPPGHTLHPPPPTTWWWTLGCKTRPLVRRPPGRSRPQTGSPGGAGGQRAPRRSYIDSASPPPTPPPSPTPPAITTNLCIRVKHCTVYWNELSTTLLNLLVTVYDTVSDVVESKALQFQQNPDA